MGRRQGNGEASISVQTEVVVVQDPELHRRQVTAIRHFLIARATPVGDAATFDAGAGAETQVATSWKG